MAEKIRDLETTGTSKVEDGVWIRKGGNSPYSPAVRSWLARRPTAVEIDQKENLPPWAIRRRRRSPLPAWYPRTPLRDITTIVRALERRRIRMRATAAHNRSLSINLTPQSVSVPSPLSLSTDASSSGVLESELLAGASTPLFTPPSIALPLLPTPSSTNASSSGILEAELLASASPMTTEQTPRSVLLQSISSPDTSISCQFESSNAEASTSKTAPEFPISSPSNAEQQEQVEEVVDKCWSSIDTIEKAVKENLKKARDEETESLVKKEAWRTSVLRSMR